MVNKSRFFQRHPILRRVLYVLVFEILAIIFTYFILEGPLEHDSGSSLLTAFLISLTAVLWNFVWNTIFEFFEKRLGLKGRRVSTRIVHAIGFEATLILLTVPLTSLLLGISFLEAFIVLIGLLVFFFVFTYVYAWIFDKIFGLPASAQ